MHGNNLSDKQTNTPPARNIVNLMRQAPKVTACVNSNSSMQMNGREREFFVAVRRWSPAARSRRCVGCCLACLMSVPVHHGLNGHVLARRTKGIPKQSRTCTKPECAFPIKDPLLVGVISADCQNPPKDLESTVGKVYSGRSVLKKFRAFVTEMAQMGAKSRHGCSLDDSFIGWDIHQPLHPMGTGKTAAGTGRAVGGKHLLRRPDANNRRKN